MGKKNLGGVKCKLAGKLDARGYPKTRYDLHLFQQVHGDFTLSKGKRFVHLCEQRACLTLEHMAILDANGLDVGPTGVAERAVARAKPTDTGCLETPSKLTADQVASVRQKLYPEYTGAICGNRQCINERHLWNENEGEQAMEDRFSMKPEWVRKEDWELYPKAGSDFSLDHFKQWCRDKNVPVTIKYFEAELPRISKYSHVLLSQFKVPVKCKMKKGSGSPFKMYNINHIDRAVDYLEDFGDD